MNTAPMRCKTGAALDAIVGKWKVTVLLHLHFEGTMRFSELKAAIPDISERMLTARLRELESQHIVKRVVYAQVPPKVEYSLSEYGKTLVPILEQMHEWGAKHVERMRRKEVERRGGGPTEN